MGKWKATSRHNVLTKLKFQEYEEPVRIGKADQQTQFKNPWKPISKNEMPRTREANADASIDPIGDGGKWHT